MGLWKTNFVQHEKGEKNVALIPYEPFRHLENMRRELDRFFSTGFPTGFDYDFGVPRVDVYETENEIVASCDMPGLEKKEDVHLDIDKNILTISGSIKRENEIKEEQMHKKERFVGRFQRSIPLPAQVEPENVKATYRNGVLEIRMPKIRTETKKQIDIKFH